MHKFNDYILQHFEESNLFRACMIVMLAVMCIAKVSMSMVVRIHVCVRSYLLIYWMYNSN